MKTTNATIELAKTLAKSGLPISAVEIQTPDGRTWKILEVPAGRGRHADGHWGKRPGALGGFRLFEIDEERETMDEHDNDEHDTWDADQLADYLRNVGQPKPGNNHNFPTT